MVKATCAWDVRQPPSKGKTMTQEAQSLCPFDVGVMQGAAGGESRAADGRGLAPERAKGAPHCHVAVGQKQWYHFGVGAPPILVYFSGDWDVHWGYGI